MRRLGTIVGLAALLLAGCKKKEAMPFMGIYKGPLLETENVLTLFSDSARLQLRLTAPLEQQYENGDIIYRKSVKVTFYEKDGKTVVNTLEADYGKLEKNTNLYTMRGHVRVANVPNQQQLATEELFYDKAKGQIYTKPETFVTVTTPTERLTGHGLTANQNFSRYRILNPEGVFALDTPK